AADSRSDYGCDSEASWPSGISAQAELGVEAPGAAGRHGDERVGGRDLHGRGGDRAAPALGRVKGHTLRDRATRSVADFVVDLLGAVFDGSGGGFAEEMLFFRGDDVGGEGRVLGPIGGGEFTDVDVGFTEAGAALGAKLQTGAGLQQMVIECAEN